MTLAPVSAPRAHDLVARFQGLHVLVAGDVMLDRFIVGRVERISPEAPVPVVRFQSEHSRLGGAANVAHNSGGAWRPGPRSSASSAPTTPRDACGANWRPPASPRTDSSTMPRVRRRKKSASSPSGISRWRESITKTIADVDNGVARRLAERIGALGQDASALLVSDYLKGTSRGRSCSRSSR